MKSLSLLLLMVLPICNLVGQEADVWRENGKPIADTPNMKSRNGFGAELFLTEDVQFFEDWSKPETPNLTPLKKARRNVPIYTVILFVNPGTDASGAANVTCDIVVHKPDGTIYGELKDVPGRKGEYLVPKHHLQLSEGRMGIRIEPQDPNGTYTVEVTVHDNIKKIDLPLKVTFDVVNEA